MNCFPKVPRLDLSDGDVDEILNRLASVKMDLTTIVGQTEVDERGLQEADAVLQEAIDFVRDHSHMRLHEDASNDRS